MAKDYRWEHGEVFVVVRTEHYGLAEQWLNCWVPQSDGEIAIILEDDNVVSRFFYRWLKRAVQAYYFNHENYDGRMYG